MAFFVNLAKDLLISRQLSKNLKHQKYSGWIVVEQDVLPGMGNPKVCAQRNREFIKSLGL